MKQPDATDKLAVVSPEQIWQSNSEEHRAKHPEIIQPFNGLVPGVDFLGGIAREPAE